jgi:hypothetical protein
MREPQRLGNAEELVQIRGQITALEKQIVRLRQEKADAAVETKAGIKEAERHGEAEVNRLTRAAEELQAAIGGAKTPPCRVDTGALHQRVVAWKRRASVLTPRPKSRPPKATLGLEKADQGTSMMPSLP